MKGLLHLIPYPYCLLLVVEVEALDLVSTPAFDPCVAARHQLLVGSTASTGVLVVLSAGESQVRIGQSRFRFTWKEYVEVITSLTESFLSFFVSFLVKEQACEPVAFFVSSLRCGVLQGRPVLYKIFFAVSLSQLSQRKLSLFS